MKYENTIIGKFIERPNRFIAYVEIESQVETVHVKNTGRCRELLTPNAEVVLEICDNPNRKTKWDLIAVKKPQVGWVNMDSQVPNKVVKEWLESDKTFFPEATYIKPEYKYGNSRIDFYIEEGDKKILMEVKGCTLEVDGQGFFPDAPTDRGAKHLLELANAVEKGYETYLVYCIAINNVDSVLPNEATDPKYTKAFKEAVAAGVKVIYLSCDVKADEITASKSTTLQEL